MTQQPDGPAAEQSGDVDQEQLVSGAEERIDDIEAEFGPNPPRRGSTPQNPDAEEKPS